MRYQYNFCDPDVTIFFVWNDFELIEELNMVVLDIGKFHYTIHMLQNVVNIDLYVGKSVNWTNY